MKQIKKKDLKEVIRLTKLWWDDFSDENDDVLYNELYQARLKAFGNPYSPLNEIIMGIRRLKGKTPLKTYYKVLEALGYELV